MRNMSFALTTEQFKAKTKTVTRRLGWEHLKVGEYVRGVKKCMGLKPGEKIEALGVIKVTDIRRERLDQITADDVRREGFPEMTRGGFVFMFCKHMKAQHDTMVTRIEFVYMQ